MWYPDPQLLRQCKFLIFHHGGQLPVTHCILCYYIIIFLSSLNDQDFPFLDFVVLSIIILLVLPTLGICGEGRLGEFGNWPRHLGEGRGPRRLSDGEQSTHVFRPHRLCCISTACRIPYPATLSTLGGEADPVRIVTWERAEVRGV